mmetsp:Transcript_7845/g.18129  ORF Transcript_7845/g.18129 Transcript_7845/m.18129 type:complete len:104 (-) Transcript_7845:535-846(-)
MAEDVDARSLVVTKEPEINTSVLLMGVGSDVQLLAAISLQWVDLTCARATEVVGDARLEGVISLPSHRPSSVSNMGVERNVRTLVVRKWLADALCTVQRMVVG